MIRAKTLMSALAATALVAACSDDDKASTTPPVAQAPRILFFLGDGMGITTLTAARIYKVGEDGDLTIDTLPETAFVHTYSNDAQVTDSAPSMAAYMTGVKMNNEVISMSADTKATDANGKPYHASYDATCGRQRHAGGNAAGNHEGQGLRHRRGHDHPHHARDARRHLLARLPPRCREHCRRAGARRRRLQRQAERRHRRILRRRHGLLPAQENGGKRNDKRNLIDEIKTRYGYAANRADFDALPTDGRKIAGLFTKSHMAYDLDRDPAKPSLADMTGKAIDALAARNKGFFLMVEGGRIDHALHATNAPRAAGHRGLRRFDQARAGQDAQGGSGSEEHAHRRHRRP